MTQALVHDLAHYPQIQFVHLNTQVSVSLEDKGKRQWQKTILGMSHVFSFSKQLLKFKPKVVYLPLTNSVSFNGFLRDALFILPPRWAGIKVIVHLKGGSCRYLRYKGWKRHLVRYVLSQVSLALVQGQSLTTIFNGFISGERVAVLPNGIDALPFDKARVGLRYCNNRTPTILFVGLLCQAKGLHDLLLAAARLRNVNFVFAGEWLSPEEKETALGIVEREGIEGCVSFPGILAGSEKYDSYVTADIFAFPTYYPIEGHALVTVEALAAGLPIVCTNHGALNESVVNGWNGYFVPKRNPEALSKCLGQLLEDEPLRCQMGERSRKLFEERFTLSKYVGNWVDIVQRCAAE